MVVLYNCCTAMLIRDREAHYSKENGLPPLAYQPHSCRDFSELECSEGRYYWNAEPRMLVTRVIDREHDPRLVLEG